MIRFKQCGHWVSAASLALCAWAPLAQAASDGQVEAQLAAAGMAYERNAAGHLMLRMGLQQDRTQIAFVDSESYAVGEARFRQVWSIGWVADQAPQWETTLRLLEESQEAPVGGWTLQSGDREYLLLYKVQVPADANLKHLMAAIYSASFAADRLELSLSGGDQL